MKLGLNNKLRYSLYAVLVSVLFSSCSKEDKIKVGQNWKYTYGVDNPYEKAIIHYREVIEITGEYVLYIQDKKDTLNDKKYWFVVSSECVKNCN